MKLLDEIILVLIALTILILYVDLTHAEEIGIGLDIKPAIPVTSSNCEKPIITNNTKTCLSAI